MWKNILTQGVLQIIILAIILFKGTHRSLRRSPDLQHPFLDWSRPRGLEWLDRKALLDLFQRVRPAAGLQRNQRQEAQVERAQHLRQLLQQPLVFSYLGQHSGHSIHVCADGRPVSQNRSFEHSWALDLPWTGFTVDLRRLHLQGSPASLFVQVFRKGWEVSRGRSRSS